MRVLGIESESSRGAASALDPLRPLKSLNQHDHSMFSIWVNAVSFLEMKFLHFFSSVSLLFAESDLLKWITLVWSLQSSCFSLQAHTAVPDTIPLVSDSCCCACVYARFITLNIMCIIIVSNESPLEVYFCFVYSSSVRSCCLVFLRVWLSLARH